MKAVKKPAPAPVPMDPSRKLLEKRKKKTKSVKAKKEEEEVFSTRDLFPYLGKKNVEQTVKEICGSNPKWASVVAYHNRIASHGIHLELDTLLRGMLLPMDYNELIRQAIKVLKPKPSSLILKPRPAFEQEIDVTNKS